MDKKCSIARDLMPLVIDEAASEDSARFVENHTAQCGECAAYYQGMRAMLPRVEESASERKRFFQAARQVRRNRWKRWILWVLASAAVVCWLAVGMNAVWQWMTTSLDRPLRLDKYEVALAELADGGVVITTIQAEPDLDTSLGVTMMSETDGLAMYVYLQTTLLPQRIATGGTGAKWNLYRNGLVDTAYGRQTPVVKVYKGQPGSCELVYEAGEQIPAASDRMEAYFAQNAEYERLLSLPVDEDRDGMELYWQVREQYYLRQSLEQQVPEWNGLAVGTEMQMMRTSTVQPDVTLPPSPDAVTTDSPILPIRIGEPEGPAAEEY